MATPEQRARAARTLDDLYRRHAPEIFRYTFAVLGNRADAEDVTQATFVNALRAIERGEQPRKPGNWLLAISHNLMRQRFRQERARPAQVELDGDLPQPLQTDDNAPSVGELVSALGRIPPSQREAIVMREFEGRSYAEIAEILGVTTSALETLLFRARRSLAEELESLVTCARAEQDVSRLLDGRLSRRERKRLQEHIRTCPACARFETFQHKQRRALKVLALLPLPASLTLFKGVHGAAAAGLPTIGAGTAVTSAAGGGAAATGGATLGGLALAGVATKAAAVVAAVAVAGGVGYEGATHLHGSANKPVNSGTTRSSHVGHVSPRAGAKVNHGLKTRRRAGKALSRGHGLQKTGSAVSKSAHRTTKGKAKVGRSSVGSSSSLAHSNRSSSTPRTHAKRTVGSSGRPATHEKPSSAAAKAPAGQAKAGTGSTTGAPSSDATSTGTSSAGPTDTSSAAPTDGAPSSGGNGNATAHGNSGAKGSGK